MRVRAQIEDSYVVYDHDTLIDARVDDVPKRLTVRKAAESDSMPQGLTTKPLGSRDAVGSGHLLHGRPEISGLTRDRSR